MILEPFAVGGRVCSKLSDGTTSSVGLTHIQLEQDSGKTVQSNVPGFSLVDLNRAGSGLMEIVSNADIRSSEQAAAYTRTLQRLLKAVGSCTGNMDQVCFIRVCARACVCVCVVCDMFFYSGRHAM
jgi:aspartyl-tRNA(Asn)/glutamyl-tRNA(Gln) amidotransferase subunit B